MTLSGQVVDEVASCASCLYVNRDFFLCPPLAESGEEGWKGWEDDIVVIVVIVVRTSTVVGRRSLSCVLHRDR
jgi:hypothetical protein